jgi:hypothetical protein
MGWPVSLEINRAWVSEDEMVSQRPGAHMSSSNASIWVPVERIVEQSPRKLWMNTGEGSVQPAENGGDDLTEAGKEEQEYVRKRLSEELGREPSKEEIDEWLRQHTESY